VPSADRLSSSVGRTRSDSPLERLPGRRKIRIPVRSFPGPRVRARRGPSRFLLAVAIAVLATGVAPAGAATTAEQAVHVMINDARAQAGVRLLPLSERLSRIAHRHSKEMASRGTLFHSSCLSCSIGGDWRRLAENVGYGPSRDSVQAQLMASAPHRDNILHPKFRRVGVGVVRQGGLVWVTQIFFA
jgi:uncharacterized protein YkwD